MNKNNKVLEVLSQSERTYDGIRFLIQYLTDTKKLDAFMANVRNIPQLKSTLDKWSEIAFTGNTRNAILTAFDWDLAPEGYDYWDAVDTDFYIAYQAAVTKGLVSSRIIYQDKLMKEFADKYCIPFLCHDEDDDAHKNQSNSTDFFPQSAPIIFNNKEDDGIEESIKNSTKDDPKSIIVKPVEVTTKLARFLAPICKHDIDKHIDTFNQVLVDNKCSDEFYYNLRNKPKYKGFEAHFLEYINHKPLYGIIYWAFNWVTTKEGISFWSDIATKVANALKNEYANGYGQSYSGYTHYNDEKPSNTCYPLRRIENETENTNRIPYRPLAPVPSYEHSPYWWDNDDDDYIYSVYSPIPKDITEMPINENYISLVVKEETVPSES